MKIYNWVFGSFFRTLGRFLFYIAMGALFIFLCSDKVSALEYNYDYISNYDVPVRSSVQYNNGTILDLGIGTMGDILINSATNTQNIINRSYQFTNSSFTIGTTYPTWIQTYAGRQMSGNLYSYSMLVCSNVSLVNSNFNIGLTSYESWFFPSYFYKSQTWSSVSSNMSEYVAGTTLNYCYDVSGYGAYKQDTTTISLRLSPSSAISGARIFILGYKIDDLGYYKENMLDDIADIIDNNMGNVATKSDIATVNQNVNNVKQEIKNVNDSITNSDTSGANSEASGFFDNFQSDNHGLTGIITTPLNLINSITSKTCSPLSLPLPFVNENLELPCMTPIYEEYFGDFYSIYKTITFGIVAYWVCVRIFYKVQDFKNPSNSEVEVLEL